MNNNNKKITPEQLDALKQIFEGIQLLDISNLAKSVGISRQHLYRMIQDSKKEESK